MNIWRVQLKPDPSNGFTYEDVLRFCKNNNIIGVGWSEIEGNINDDKELRSEIQNLYPNSATSALKAINAIRKMKPDDLVWTRTGGDASEYYLCKVDDLLWKDRIVTKEHINHDIGNFVSVKWVYVGKEDSVPGKVVNSFCVPSTAQRILGIEMISQNIWNNLSIEPKNKYDDIRLSKDEFWNLIGSEELECLVLLYLQTKGYLIYSSTLKESSARFEVIMVSNDGSHKCFPQIKRESSLLPLDYSKSLNNVSDKVFLFTTSENYGEKSHPQVICLTKNELELFIRNQRNILPKSILNWLDTVEK